MAGSLRKRRDLNPNQPTRSDLKTRSEQATAVTDHQCRSPEFVGKCGQDVGTPTGSRIELSPIDRIPGVSEKPTLYVFMDESGDMQFTAKGSQHFILSAVITDTPCESAAVLQRLKYEQIAKGSQDFEFHATSNTPGTRKVVAESIRSMNSFVVHTLWIDKAYAHYSKQNPPELFAIFGKAMGTYLGKVVW